VLSDEDWGYVLEALGQKARWSAQLLAGIMPQDIERAFAASGRRLFPFKLQEVRSECSCPDKANPCKHASAVYYLMGDRFSEDPFVLFQLRGRTRSQLLADLALQRRELLQQRAQALRASQGAAAGATATTAHPIPGAISDPGRWWRYDAPLDPALVVITPALEGDTGLEEAGPLPLAEDGRFPEANQHFLAHLKAQALGLAQAAMATAMAAGRTMGEDPPAPGASEPAKPVAASGGSTSGPKGPTASKAQTAAQGAGAASNKAQPRRR
jgi:uncharacterized Zn finger protein